MLMYFDPGSVVPDEAAGGTDGDVDTADQPSPTPPQDAPNEPEDTPEVTGDQADDPKDTASPVSQGLENGTQTIPFLKEYEGTPRKPSVQKRQTDQQVGSLDAREKFTAGIVSGVAMGALAAQLICFCTDPISLIPDRRSYSSLNGPHRR